MFTKARQQFADALSLNQRRAERMGHRLRILLRQLSLRPLNPGLRRCQRLVDFMHNAGGDLAERIQSRVLIIPGSLLGVLPLQALPEHTAPRCHDGRPANKKQRE
ncbi:hypothetical protein D3C81_1764670 [compost metagenome]